MKLTLCLLLVLRLLPNQSIYNCKREIVETYGINSYSQPAREPLIFCPSIRGTCCPAYEQFKMFSVYNERIRPGFGNYDSAIKKALTLLGTEVSQLFDKNSLAQAIAGISNKSRKLQAEQLYAVLSRRKFSTIIERTLRYQEPAGQYMAGLKSVFFCTICDYNNQNFIDMSKNVILFSDDSCDDLVKNTITYANIMNRSVVSFLERLSLIFSKINEGASSLKITNFDHIRKSVRDCANEYSKIDSQLSNCRKYCSYFKMNSNSPVIEGYLDFFANMLVQVRTGGKAATASTPARTSRLLEEDAEAEVNPNLAPEGEEIEVLNDKPQELSKEDLIIDHFEEDEKETKKTKRVHNKERILQSNSTFFDDLENLQATQSTSSFDLREDPRLDDNALSEMVKIQEILAEEGATDLEKMVHRYYVDNYIAEMDDIDSDELFKMSYPVKVNLNTYTSSFGFNGINFREILSNINWSLTLTEIAKSLQGGQKDERIDLIDPTLITFLNRIGDPDVKDFHRDQYVRAEIKEIGDIVPTQPMNLRRFRTMIDNFLKICITGECANMIALYTKATDDDLRKLAHNMRFLQDFTKAKEKLPKAKVFENYITGKLPLVAPGSNQRNATVTTTSKRNKKNI